jgi:hypothetical protein
MTDGNDTADAICPWCSAVLPNPNVERCPSCNAALTAGTDETVPGLTALDAEAIIRAKTPTRQRSRLLSWFGGDSPDDNISPADAGAIAPPDPAVKREMLKLQIAADIANLQAEAVAIQTDAALEGRTVDLPSAVEMAAMATGAEAALDALPLTAEDAAAADEAAAAVETADAADETDAAAVETADAAAETADAAAETAEAPADTDPTKGDTPA